MLEQFVTVLPGTLAPALLVMVFSVLLSVGEGRDKPFSSSWRGWGLALGTVAAVVFALLRATAVLDRRTMVNYPTLIACVVVDVAALSVVLLARRVTEDWHQHRVLLHLSNGIADLAVFLTVFRALPDVILRLTAFVEPGAPVFTSDMLLRALGFLLGIIAAIVVAAVFRTMKATCSYLAFTVTSFLLIFLILVQHATDLFAIMQTTGDLVLRGTAFRLMSIFYNSSLKLVLAQTCIFLIPAAACLIAGFRLPLEGADAAHTRLNKAFKRKAFASAVWSLVAMIGVTLTLTVGVAQVNKVPVLSPPEEYSLSSGTATIQFAKVDDGHLHRFEYKAKDGTVMRFIIIRKHGAAYGIGLDACENCGDAGYYEKDGKIICKKCDVAINLATIGFKGGCNPIPLPYKTTKGAILIQTADLDALSSHFKS